MDTELAVSPRVLLPLLVLAALMLGLAVVGKVPLSYNLRNLFVRWRITLLTALAFTLVVSLLTVMLAFVNGMNRLTQGSGIPSNVLVMADGATDEQFSSLGYRDTADVDRHPLVVRDEAGQPVSSRETYIIVNQPIPNATEGGRQRRFIQVRGVDDPVMSGRVHNLPLRAGGAWFSQAGVQDSPSTTSTGQTEQPIQAVLGQGIAREFGRDQGRETLVPGDLFELGPRTWVVTGVMESAGSTFDSEIWTKRQIVGPMFGKESYSSVVLRAASPKAAKELAEDLTKNFKKAAVLAQVETDYYAKLQETNKQFLVAILFVAAVMAVGGVFGVMNTMFAAISSRIRDIGVLRILGFARWQILTSFFLEAMLIALIGGTLGCAVGSLADGWTASSIVSGGQGAGKSVLLKLVVDAQILSAGMLFTLIMGAVGGLLPALSAMRLKPLDSLR